MIWVRDNCVNNVVSLKSGGDECNIAMLSWLPFHNRLMKLFNFWSFTTKMIDIYDCNTGVFVFCES